jgi:hypothetical protein
LRNRRHVLSIMPIKVYRFDTLLPDSDDYASGDAWRVNNR